MLLHAVQDQFGYISRQAVEWIAAKLETAADQHLRTGDLLPHVSPETGGQMSSARLPHLELCFRPVRYKIARALAKCLGLDFGSSWRANHVRRQIHGLNLSSA